MTHWHCMVQCRNKTRWTALPRVTPKAQKNTPLAGRGEQRRRRSEVCRVNDTTQLFVARCLFVPVHNANGTSSLTRNVTSTRACFYRLVGQYRIVRADAAKVDDGRHWLRQTDSHFIDRNRVCPREEACSDLTMTATVQCPRRNAVHIDKALARRRFYRPAARGCLKPPDPLYF
jgi:hypothetical protein